MFVVIRCVVRADLLTKCGDLDDLATHAYVYDPKASTYEPSSGKDFLDLFGGRAGSDVKVFRNQTQ